MDREIEARFKALEERIMTLEERERERVADKALGEARAQKYVEAFREIRELMERPLPLTIPRTH